MKIYKIANNLNINNIQFVLSPSAQRAGHKIVSVNTNIFDNYFSQENDFYIGQGGSGNSIGNRYSNFKEFLEKGIPIEVSQVYIGKDNRIGFGNGRHRYAVLRDMGLNKMPVSITRAEKMGIL